MDSAATSFILGYHGCDRDVAEAVFAGRDVLHASHNDYDWLADGIYFWEHNARRAYDFACQLRDLGPRVRQQVEHPAVVGAVIDLGVCLNLLDSRFIEFVRLAHRDLVELNSDTGKPLPANALGPDRLLRRLDCEVIRTLHRTRERRGDAPFDTVRAAFIEGGPLYGDAGFAAKNHIQVCVRDPAAIKRYFRPLGDDGRPLSFTAA